MTLFGFYLLIYVFLQHNYYGLRYIVFVHYCYLDDHDENK